MMRRYLFALVALIWASALALAHDVKDPVCRMMVDSDTTPYRATLGGKSFYFCSDACAAKFRKEPSKYTKLAAALEGGKQREYTVTITPQGTPRAGKPVPLTIAVRYKDTRKLVPEFEVIHEKLLHLVMTSADLSYFEHQHPVRGNDGLFRITWTFPKAGTYRLYQDFTPADGDNQVIPVPLVVKGRAVAPVPLRPESRWTKTVGDLTFSLTVAPGLPLRSEKAALLTYRIQDTAGRPVRDLEPFIGAMGHLLAISADGSDVVHTHAVHPTEASAHAAEGLKVAHEQATAAGPAFSFKLTIAGSGYYKTWAQFARRGKIYTVPFTFRVAELWDTR